MALDPDALRAAKRESAERRRHVNREKIIERTRARQREMKQFIIDGKRRPCTDCGLEYPPFAMDYDHVPELGEKKYGIASLHKRGLTTNLDTHRHRSGRAALPEAISA